MRDLITEISQADSSQIGDLLKAVMHRYSVLFPDWEVSTVSLDKNSDRNKQLDNIIQFLQSMKTEP